MEGSASKQIPEQTPTPTGSIEGRKSVPSLFGDLLHEVTTLFHNEVQLVRAEVSQKVTQIETGAGSLGASAVLGFAALLLLLEAAVFGLGLLVDLWLSALIVGVGVAIVAWIMFAVGRRKLRAQNLAPRATLSEMRRDKEFVKEQMR